MLRVSSLRPCRNQSPPVCVEVALGIAPEATCHPGERLAADELADVARADERPAFRIDHVHRHAEVRASQRTRLDRDRRRGREEAGAYLRPTGAVDDWTAAAANLLEEPSVWIRVPRLAGRHDRAQGGEIGLGVAMREERANDGR